MAGTVPKTTNELAVEFVTGGVHHDFVKEYYETMTEKTDEVYRFYMPDNAYLSHGAEKGSEETFTGQIAIKAKISTLGLAGSRIEITQRDCQVGVTGTVVIQTIGVLSLADGARRKFVQTFCLSQSRGQDDTPLFCIQNDIFRYLDDGAPAAAAVPVVAAVHAAVPVAVVVGKAKPVAQVTAAAANHAPASAPATSVAPVATEGSAPKEPAVTSKVPAKAHLKVTAAAAKSSASAPAPVPAVVAEALAEPHAASAGVPTASPVPAPAVSSSAAPATGAATAPTAPKASAKVSNGKSFAAMAGNSTVGGGPPTHVAGVVATATATATAIPAVAAAAPAASAAAHAAPANVQPRAPRPAAHASTPASVSGAAPTSSGPKTGGAASAAASKSLYLKDVPASATVADITALFTRLAEAAPVLVTIKDRKTTSATVSPDLKHAFVDFDTTAAVEKCLQLSPSMFILTDGSKLLVEKSVPNGGKMRSSATSHRNHVPRAGAAAGQPRAHAPQVPRGQPVQA